MLISPLFFTSFGDCLEPYLRYLGPSWGLLEASFGFLGATLDHLGAILSHLGVILGHLGPLEGHLGPLEGHLAQLGGLVVPVKAAKSKKHCKKQVKVHLEATTLARDASEVGFAR